MDAWIRRVTALTALVGAILIGAAGAQAELTVKGDIAAWKELHAAFKRLGSLSGYRSKSTLSMGTVIMEVVPPHSYRSITQVGSVTREDVNVNGHARSRMTVVPNVPGRWQCSEVSPRDFSGFTEAGEEGTVEVSRGPTATIEGIPVRAYQYAYTYLVSGRLSKNITYVGAETGLPVRTVTWSFMGEETTDYYDYGAKIEITLPPCG